MTDELSEYMMQAQEAMQVMQLDAVEQVVCLLIDAWKEDRQIFLMGNGGSSATASHFVNDLNKTAIVPRRSRFKAIALTDNVPLMTAWANDESYESIFAQQMINFIESGDIVVGISTSGNSPNIIAGIQFARAVGAKTVGLTGLTGGKLKDLVDYYIAVPTDDILQIEGIHSVVLHAIIARFRHLLTSDRAQRRELTSSAENGRPAVFIDRDGVINENRSDYVKSWDEFILLPGVIRPLRKLARNHHAVVIVSNQSAIGRGIVSRSRVDDINDRMLDVIHAVGGRVDGVYYCPHHPDEVCECRKPRPGLFLQAAQQLGLDLESSFIIGDALSDVQAALEVGSVPILVLTGRGKEELPKLRAAGYTDIPVVDDLDQAIELMPTLAARG